MNKDEALRLALEALEWSKPHADAEITYQEAITAIKTALEAKDEPVGKFAKFTDGIWREVTDGSAGVPLYTTPPQRTWVGLTDEDMKDPKTHNFDFIYGARWAEAKLKERNT
jgi:hypothetical protein